LCGYGPGADCRRTAPNAAPSAAAERSIVVANQGTSYILTVPRSRLMLTLPKNGLVWRRGAGVGGAASNPRYFYFHDDRAALVVSGWFEPGHRFKRVRED
jgi:hypothetical protein